MFQDDGYNRRAKENTYTLSDDGLTESFKGGDTPGLKDPSAFEYRIDTWYGAAIYDTNNRRLLRPVINYHLVMIIQPGGKTDGIGSISPNIKECQKQE